MTTPPASAAGSPGSAPAAVSAVDRLLTVYRAPGPYVSLYLTVGGVGLAADSDDAYWKSLRDDLIERGATEESLDAAAARLRLPRSGETAGICIIAAADGTTAVANAFEPPKQDVAVVATLPYAAPMLEWDQRSVPHVVVTVDRPAEGDDQSPVLGGDVVAFGADRYTSLDTIRGGPDDLADMVRTQVDAIGARLVVVDGSAAATQPLLDSLATALPIDIRVVQVYSFDADELADTTVRYAADTAARTTVDRLRTHKFLKTHDSAVDGTADTIAALADGSAEWILVHDDPSDQRQIHVGPEPHLLSLEPRDGYVPGRLVDAVIRGALAAGAGVHIIPSTGSGPDEDIAAILDSAPEL